MLKHTLLFALALASYMAPSHVFAHAEHDKARFVAPNGVDQGNCNNPVRPCKSISYAVAQASKGDKVLVSKGQYTISSESELFYLKSELVPVLGGYNRFEHFQVQSPDINITSLVGAPVELHDTLHKAGFKVITDKKSLQISSQLRDKLARNQALSKAQSNQSCVNGRAGSFSCRDVDLVAHVPLPNGASGSDIWGHIDLNTGTEYAIMGFSDGTRVYNLQTPSSPTLVGFIQGNRTSWRDIKVYQYYNSELNAYQAYAYVTAEGSNSGATSGVQIIDLNNLPQSVSLAKSDVTVSTAHNVYISNLDYGLNIPNSAMPAKLQIVGANRFGGAFVSFDLSDAAAPAKNFDVGSSIRANYTHDATSMMVDDERAQRDCVNAASGVCDVFIDFNEDEIRIWDNTNVAQTARLGQVGYDDVPKADQYVHSGWWHENKRYVYVQDETDEIQGGLNTTLRILDLADLNNPIVAGKWVNNNRTIDHNGFVKGNRYYMSNYERGLTILDISDPVNPVEVGYFDTFPSSDNASFNGAWGTYPYLPSGNILISDINSGLYLVKDQSLSNAAQVSFATSTSLVERGQELAIAVNKPTAVAQGTSVYFELINGSAANNTDVRLLNDSNQLTWAANDNEPKTIRLSILDNGENTAKNLFVRLHNASGELQISQQYIQQININGVASPGKVGFVQSQLSVSESAGQTSINVQRIGGASGQITVDYDISYVTADSADVEFSSGTLSWNDADTSNKTINFTVVDDQAIENSETFTLTLTNADASLLGTKTITVSIEDNDANTAPTVYAGNDVELATNASTTLTSATISDPENDSFTMQWRQSSGVSLTLTNTDSLGLTIAASGEAGTATLVLTATDSHGATSSDEMTVTVVAPVTPTTPSVNTQSSGSSGGSISFWLLGLVGLLLSRRKGYLH